MEIWQLFRWSLSTPPLLGLVGRLGLYLAMQAHISPRLHMPLHRDKSCLSFRQSTLNNTYREYQCSQVQWPSARPVPAHLLFYIQYNTCQGCNDRRYQPMHSTPQCRWKKIGQCLRRITVLCCCCVFDVATVMHSNVFHLHIVISLMSSLRMAQ